MTDVESCFQYLNTFNICIHSPQSSRSLVQNVKGSAQKLLGILSAKCPVFEGLLRAAYAKLFLYDPLELSPMNLFNQFLCVLRDSVVNRC